MLWSRGGSNKPAITAHNDVAETMSHVTMIMMVLAIDDEKRFRMICHMPHV